MLPGIPVSADLRAVRNNNADVLVLSGRAARALWRFRNFRHAKYVAWRPSWSLAAVAVAVACLLQFLLARIAWCGVVSFDAGRKRRLVLFRVRRRRQLATARRYIPHALG